MFLHCRSSLVILILIQQEEAPKGVKLANLVPVPQKGARPKHAGRPLDPLLLELTILLQHPETKELYWRCVAPKCRHYRKGRPQKNRVLRHTNSCRDLSSALRAKSNDASADTALGAKLQASHSGSAPKKIKKNAGTTQTTLLATATASGRADLQVKLNNHVLKLICVQGMVPAMIDSKRWKAFMADANPCYDSPSSDTFREKFIPAEAALVRKLKTEHLR